MVLLLNALNFSGGAFTPPLKFIVAIAAIDNNGNIVVQYNYDAWGNHKVLNASGVEIVTVNDIGNLNPFRYRGYYYDEETRLYYLNARYYDPEIGRFISPDSINNVIFLAGCIQSELNSYMYCLNDPINFVDYGGYLHQRQGDWIIIDKRLKFRLNDKDHIHVIYNNQEYAWFEESKKTKDPKTNLGLNDLPKPALKKLKNAGVPKSFFNQMSYVNLPRWQEGFSLNNLPRWQEGFSLNNLPRWQEEFSTPQIGQSNVVIYVSIGAGIVVLCCVVAAFFTGGQSLWGLLALA